MKYLSLWPNETSSTAFNLFKHFDNEFARELSGYSPALDIVETDQDFQVSLDIPGIKKEDIKIEVKDRSLLVSGERKREVKDEHGMNRSERSFGQFTRTLQLPLNVDTTKIEAQYEDGVLKLTIPKSEAAQPRLIDIK